MQCYVTFARHPNDSLQGPMAQNRAEAWAQRGATRSGLRMDVRECVTGALVAAFDHTGARIEAP